MNFLTSAPVLKTRKYNWEIEYYLSGKRVRVSLGTHENVSKAQAERKYMEQCAEIYSTYPIQPDGTPQAKPKKYNVEEALQLAFESHQLSGEIDRPTTIYCYKNTIERFVKYLVATYGAVPNLCDLTHHTLNDFKEYRLKQGLKSGTVKNDLDRIKKLIRILIEKDLHTMHVDRVKIKPHVAAIKPTYTESELKTLMETCECPERRLMYNLVLFGFIRNTECMRIKWSDIDMDYTDKNGNKGKITVVAEASKNKKTQSVGMHPTLRAEIEKYFKDTGATKEGLVCPINSKLHKTTIRNRFRKQLRDNNLRSELTIYGLKYTGVQLMQAHTKDPVAVSTACRHSNPAVTGGYMMRDQVVVVEW